MIANVITHWLDNLGLSQYASVFTENAIDLEVMPELTEADLESLGVLLGHRKKILKAIADLPTGSGEAAAPLQKTQTPGALEPSPTVSEAERRQLTVMFCDLVGSTSLSERLDPEDLRDVLRAYQAACAEVIDRYDGHIAKYIGDGLLVYFGYPQAHEDDAERAVRAGLEVVAEIERLSGRLTEEKGIELAVRLGLHTGLVVAGEMGAGEVREDLAIVGETPNVAARLEALAQPNSVVISDGTRRLVEGLFICVPLGPQRLKGIMEPLEVFRVSGESEARSRFEAIAERGLTPLVGREEEIGLLLKRWSQAKEGEGQVVVLSGEAGVGKSRILRSLRDRLEGEPHNRVLYYCSPYRRNSAFYPVIAQMERALRFENHDDPAAKFDKLDGVLTGLGLATVDLGPLFANLLSLPTGERYPRSALGPEQVKRRTIEAVIQVVVAMARRQPVLMVVEDAHWIDPTTLALLSHLVEQIAPARVLLFITHRPEFEPPWHAESQVTGLALNRLSRKESSALVLKLTEGKALPETVMDQILGKTDGVPLFVEELTKTVLESGFLEDSGDRFTLSGPLPPLAIPASLQDSLMARLDRLAPVKDVAQLAATFGRIFGRDLLAAVSPLEEEALEDALSQLVEAGLIYRRSFGAGATYEFKHALVQDAAYQSLLKSTRQQHHQRIAEVLEQRFPTITEAEPEILAHHCTEAQLIDKAVDYWHQAGARAIKHSANLEAVAHLSRALDLLEMQPESVERARRELGLRVSLGIPLTATKGPGAPDVYESYSRAQNICQSLGDASQAFLVSWGLWRCCQATGKMREARDLGDELLSLAQQQGDPEWILEAHHVQWTTLTKLGEPAACWEQAKQGIALYEPEKHHAHAFSYTDHDPGVCSRGVGAMSLWSIGYPDQARTRALEAIELAENLGHPSSQALAQIFSSYVSLLRGEYDMARDCLDAARARSTEQGFAHYLATAKILRGWLLVRENSAAEGLELIREGVESGDAKGTGATNAFYLLLFAGAYGRQGELGAGLEVLSRALDEVEESGARQFEPEMHRVRGELLCRGNGKESLEAEVCFAKALEVARLQEARSLELRAAVSLARLWRDHGKTAQARDLLAPVYDWFTEGFDTDDLKEAKALLEELA